MVARRREYPEPQSGKGKKRRHPGGDELPNIWRHIELFIQSPGDKEREYGGKAHEDNEFYDLR